MARGVIEKEIVIYADEDGTEPYTAWLGRLKDKQTIKRIQTQLLRLEQGNYGDYKSLKDGVFELRLRFRGQSYFIKRFRGQSYFIMYIFLSRIIVSKLSNYHAISLLDRYSQELIASHREYFYSSIFAFPSIIPLKLTRIPDLFSPYCLKFLIIIY